MMLSGQEEEEMKEWETLASITTDADQTEYFSFEFAKGYKEVAVFFTYPINSGNTSNQTLEIWLNGLRSFGAAGYLLYSYAQQIAIRIETQPFNRCCILRSDINPKWYSTNAYLIDKVIENLQLTEINKILIGSEKKGFIFGAGTTIVIKGR